MERFPLMLREQNSEKFANFKAGEPMAQLTTDGNEQAADVFLFVIRFCNFNAGMS
jgi:hypothetical protein